MTEEEFRPASSEAAKGRWKHARSYIDDTPALRPLSQAGRAGAAALKPHATGSDVLSGGLPPARAPAPAGPRTGVIRDFRDHPGAEGPSLKELNIPVIALSAAVAGRWKTARTSARKLFGLRESGSIEQDAYVVGLFRLPRGILQGSAEKPGDHGSRRHGQVGQDEMEKAAWPPEGHHRQASATARSARWTSASRASFTRSGNLVKPWLAAIRRRFRLSLANRGM